jgi:CRP/FNR family cyclic AMP-dependent transcriptional regulator
MTIVAKQKVDLLRAVELFSGLDESTLRAVAEATSEVEFAPGRYIMLEGQIGSGLFIIISGSVRVVHGDEVLARLGPGDFFGELAVLDQAPRAASVVAEEQTVCLALASWDFLRLLERDPKLSLALLRALAGRIRALAEHHRH